MKFRFTLSRQGTSIPSTPSWDDLGNGAAAWTGNSVTLGAMATSNWLGEPIGNPYKGTYRFLITASGTVNGGGGHTAQVTLSFLDADQNIIESSDPIDIPNAGLSNMDVSFDATFMIPHYIMLQVNDLTGDGSNTVTVNAVYQTRTNTKVISEPDGWAQAKIKWERDKSLFSLIEHYVGGANSAFIFYGSNGDEDGGIDFIRETEKNFGYDASIQLKVEWSDDYPDNFTTLFQGLLDLSNKTEMVDNRVQIPVIRDDAWAKLVNRWETPVNLSDLVDLDGSPVDPVNSIEVYLPSQIIRKRFEGDLFESRTWRGTELTVGHYIQLDVDHYALDEILDKHTIPIVTNPEPPVAGFMTLEEGGEYTLDIRFEISIVYDEFVSGYPDCQPERKVVPSETYLDVYVQINEGDPVKLSVTSSPLVFDNVSSIYTYQDTLELNAGDQVKLYAEIIGDISALGEGNSATLFIHSKNNMGLMYEPTPFADPGTETCGFLPADEPTTVTIAAPSLEELPSYIHILGKTVFPDTRAEGYLIHDVIDGVLRRIGANPLYSEFLGHTSYTSRSYDQNGCGWMYAVIKGLQLRGYTLTEKPFFASMKDLWEGLNPIQNLALGYDVISTDAVVRIEQKSHFFESTPSAIFSNVRDIQPSYDADYIFKTIKVGYKQWQGEKASGLDDPQSKQTRATILGRSGTDLTIESEFIAASLTIENTRRQTKEKSADYRFDNNNFIIALNTDDLSPDVYIPELDENFASITNLNDPETRYNSLLTPLRNLLRWADFWSGCLQPYLNSLVKFVSGEGNYDMTSEFTDNDGCNRGVLEDGISEKDDIKLTFLEIPSFQYKSRFPYLFLPQDHRIVVPMDKSDFESLDRTKPIAISQTDSGHVNFYIKEMDYDIMQGRATFIAWPKSQFDLEVVEQEFDNICVPVQHELDAKFRALIKYAQQNGITLPSTEEQVILSDMVAELREAEIFDELDNFYFSSISTQAFARLNYISPGDFTLQDGVAPTFVPGKGFKGDGSTKYLTTGWDPATNGVKFTQTNASAFAYSHTNDGAAGNAFLFGSRDGSNVGRVELLPKNINNQHVGAINSAGSTTGLGTAVSAKGFFHVQRRNDNDLRLFKDGAQVGATDTTTPSDGLNNDDIALLATNANGTVGGFSEETIGVYGSGSSLTGKEDTLYQIINKALTRLANI